MRNLKENHHHQPSTSISDAAAYSDDAVTTSDSSEFSPLVQGVSMQSRQGLTYLALMCERVSVSDSAGAILASAVLNHFEVIGDDNSAGDNYRLYFETVWTAFLPCQFCSCNNLCKTSRLVGTTPSGN